MSINLLKEESKRLSTIRIIFGILFLLLSGSYLFSAVGNESSRTWDWISFGVFLLNGIYHLSEGLGYLLGKAYILINSELISFKVSVYKKEQSVCWNEIETISYNFYVNKFEIKKTDHTNMILNLSKFEYTTVKKIKETIDHYAKEKNIPIEMLKSD
ncbi:MAG: hypothetical protein LBH22_03270 [Bacteroidales bacterium]|nr:hypothetical protein [Bacteroidales bacterium]